MAASYDLYSSRRLKVGDHCKVENALVADLNGCVGRVGELDYHSGRWPLTLTRADTRDPSSTDTTAEREVTVTLNRNNLRFVGGEFCGKFDLKPKLCSRCLNVRYW